MQIWVHNSKCSVWVLTIGNARDVFVLKGAAGRKHRKCWTNVFDLLRADELKRAMHSVVSFFPVVSEGKPGISDGQFWAATAAEDLAL